MKQSFMNKGMWVLVIGLCLGGISVGLLYLATTDETKEPPVKESSVPYIADLTKNIQERAGPQYEKKRLQLSIAVYEKILKAAPNNSHAKKKLARAYYRLGTLEKKLGNEAASRENIAKARKLDPTISDTP